METNPPAPPIEPAAQLPRRKTGWPLIFVALLVPPLVTTVAILLGAKQGGTAPAIAVFGGGLSGIICGAMLGRRFGTTGVTQLMLGIVLALVMGAACIAMSCFGCIAGGYELDIP